MRFTVRDITFCALVAALYAALTLLLAPIGFGLVQFRVSEALCILPYFCPQTAWGLFVGCAVSNLIGGFGLLDIVLGSLATLMAGVCTALIRYKPLACLPPVFFNAGIVGAVLTYELTRTNFLRAYAVNAATLAVEEAAVMFCIGLPLMYLLPKWKLFVKIMNSHGGKRI